MIVALILAFYVRPEELWAVKNGETWVVAGKSRKGGAMFEDRISELCREMKKEK